jgi:hypothetical protein
LGGSYPVRTQVGSGRVKTKVKVEAAEGQDEQEGDEKPKVGGKKKMRRRIVNE